MRYYSEENVIDLLDAFMDKVNDETREDLKTLIRDRAKADNFDVIEVPTPHGRCIDADKLKDIIISCIKDAEKEHPKEDFALVKMVYESCLYHIMNAPTILESTEGK